MQSFFFARFVLLGAGFFAGIVSALLTLAVLKKPDAPSVDPRFLGTSEAPPVWDTTEGDAAIPVSESPPKNQISFQSVEDDLRSGPIPIEWEGPLFSVLEMEDMDRRNAGLIQMATVTARQVPRVQAECLAHLTYALEEKDYAQFLALIRNPSLPLGSRIQFLEETLKIRRPEFSEWLARNLVNQPEVEISQASRRFLAEAGAPTPQPEEKAEGPF